jgi:hypothetical protein
VIKPKAVLNRCPHASDYKNKEREWIMKTLLMFALFVPFFVVTLRDTRQRVFARNQG